MAAFASQIRRRRGPTGAAARIPRGRPTGRSSPIRAAETPSTAFSRVTFTRAGRPRAGIHVVDPTGSGGRLLIEDAFGPAWSPDGSEILFATARDRNGETCFHDCRPSAEIYVARADGTAPRRLTTSEADDGSPGWSPDSKRVVFSSDRRDRDNHEYEIYVMRGDGSGVRRLTTNNVWDQAPDWRSSRPGAG